MEISYHHLGFAYSYVWGHEISSLWEKIQYCAWRDQTDVFQVQRIKQPALAANKCIKKSELILRVF